MIKIIEGLIPVMGVLSVLILILFSGFSFNATKESLAKFCAYIGGSILVQATIYGVRVGCDKVNNMIRIEITK